jgi:hypothetical protein
MHIPDCLEIAKNGDEDPGWGSGPKKGKATGV